MTALGPRDRVEAAWRAVFVQTSRSFQLGPGEPLQWSVDHAGGAVCQAAIDTADFIAVGCAPDESKPGTERQQRQNA